MIGCFKLLNGVISIAATCAIVHLFHKNVAQHAASWLDHFNIESDNPIAAACLWRLRFVQSKQLYELALLSSFYSVLFLTEGVGLLLKRRWAEYLALIATGFFIPFEVYEIFRQPSVLKALLLSINTAVVVYLVFVIGKKKA